MTIRMRRPWTDTAGNEHTVSEYDLVDHGPGFVRGKIRGEVRHTDEGDPVVWDLVLTSHETFAWHRTDWPDGSFTKSLTRCAPTVKQVLHQTDRD